MYIIKKSMSEIRIFRKVIEDLFFREFHITTLICG